MSLVNDMLKDLDARNADESARMPDAIALPMMEDRGANPIFILTLFTIALAVAVYLFGKVVPPTTDNDLLAEQPPAAQQPADTVAVNTENATALAALRDLPPTAMGSAEEPVYEPAALDELDPPADSGTASVQQSLVDNTESDRVDQLVAAAQAALFKERLTTPVNDNAWLYVQQLLAIDPTNTAALALQNTIVEHYIGLIDKQLAAANLSRAERLVARAASVNAGAPQLQQRMDRLKALQARVAEQVAAPPAVASVAPVITRPSDDTQVLASAQANWAHGNRNAAIDQLAAFIAKSPTTAAVRVQLFEWYAQTGQWAQAEALLQNTPGVTDADKTLMTAKLLVARNDDVQAMRLLVENAPAFEQHAGYYAYLAGLYQKAGHHQAAANLYRQLLQMDNEQSTYWLGLALALDGLQNQQALQAYRQVERNGQVNADVQRYVSQRIDELSN